jgi:hypothetical protein
MLSRFSLAHLQAEDVTRAPLAQRSVFAGFPQALELSVGETHTLILSRCGREDKPGGQRAKKTIKKKEK